MRTHMFEPIPRFHLLLTFKKSETKAKLVEATQALPHKLNKSGARLIWASITHYENRLQAATSRWQDHQLITDAANRASCLRDAARPSSHCFHLSMPIYPEPRARTQLSATFFHGEPVWLCQTISRDCCTAVYYAIRDDLTNSSFNVAHPSKPHRSLLMLNRRHIFP